MAKKEKLSLPDINSHFGVKKESLHSISPSINKPTPPNLDRLLKPASALSIRTDMRKPMTACNSTTNSLPISTTPISMEKLLPNSTSPVKAKTLSKFPKIKLRTTITKQAIRKLNEREQVKSNVIKTITTKILKNEDWDTLGNKYGLTGKDKGLRHRRWQS